VDRSDPLVCWCLSFFPYSLTLCFLQANVKLQNATLTQEVDKLRSQIMKSPERMKTVGSRIAAGLSALGFMH
jgi:hypothetical protein